MVNAATLPIRKDQRSQKTKTAREASDQAGGGR